MIKVKWSKEQKMIYTEDIFKIIFGKYGTVKSVAILPSDRKALIEFEYRLSAEKAYKENTKEEKEKRGFDDGLKISLLVKDKDQNKDEKNNDLSLNSGNISKISNLLNRDSKIVVGSRDEEYRRIQERQRLINDILAKEGLNT